MPQCSLSLAHYTNYLLTVSKCQHTTLQQSVEKALEVAEVIQEWESRLASWKN